MVLPRSSIPSDRFVPDCHIDLVEQLLQALECHHSRELWLAGFPVRSILFLELQTCTYASLQLLKELFPVRRLTPSFLNPPHWFFFFFPHNPILKEAGLQQGLSLVSNTVKK